jgi:hypothetical protein
MCATATKTKKQERTAKLMTLGNSQVLALTTGKDTVFYKLEALAADRGTGFRLSKADRGDGPGEVYDVLLDGQFSSCECKGFLRWNHCKHLEALTALCQCGKIAASKPEAKPAPKPQQAAPAVCDFLEDL